MLPALLTITEAADVCRVHPRTIERWCEEGRLRRVRLAPKTIRYLAADVAALIDPQNDRDPAANGATLTTSTLASGGGEGVTPE
jgi:excisionase family DNA binding protein